MMKIKRAVLMAVLVVAGAALAVALGGPNARAARRAAGPKGNVASKITAAAAKATASQQNVVVAENPVAQDLSRQDGRISAETLKAMGIQRSKDPNASARLTEALKNSKGKGKGSTGDFTVQSGQPLVLDARSALSSALITNIGGRDNQFSEVALVADWDGRKDCAADREQKVDDFSFAELEIDFTLMRAAISEHTVANGFNENVYYYGDSVGNLWVGTDLNPNLGGGGSAAIDTLRQVNIPALVTTGASGGFTLL